MLSLSRTYLLLFITSLETFNALHITNNNIVFSKRVRFRKQEKDFVILKQINTKHQLITKIYIYLPLKIWKVAHDSGLPESKWSVGTKSKIELLTKSQEHPKIRDNSNHDLLCRYAHTCIHISLYTNSYILNNLIFMIRICLLINNHRSPSIYSCCIGKLTVNCGTKPVIKGRLFISRVIDNRQTKNKISQG